MNPNNFKIFSSFNITEMRWFQTWIMPRIWLQPVLLCITYSCSINCSDNNINIIVNKQFNKFIFKEYSYFSMSIPAFFQKLVSNHYKDFSIRDSAAHKSFFNDYDINPADTSNLNTYYTFLILHKLLTSQTALNGSRGKILNIPYYWHWVKPNPRDEIRNLNNKLLLKDIKPSAEFSKYHSFADIDRTPFLFLSDLLADKPGYYSPLCDTFATFGWCSEREMAFVCLMDILGYSGKVVVDGNHSRSEFIVTMRMNNEGSPFFKVRIDNTFDNMEWEQLECQEIEKWENEQLNTKVWSWYNLQAHSPFEKLKIIQSKTSVSAMHDIEKKLVNYLNSEYE